MVSSLHTAKATVAKKAPKKSVVKKIKEALTKSEES